LAVVREETKEREIEKKTLKAMKQRHGGEESIHSEKVPIGASRGRICG
jgi:hypothetical protein